MMTSNWFDQWELSQLRHALNLRLRGRSATGRDGQQGKDLVNLSDDELASLAASCATGEYRFSPYKQLLVVKNAVSKPRQVAIPQSRDFLVQKILLKYLQDIAPVKSPNAPKLVSALKTLLSENASFLRLDLRDFYGSIPHSLLESILVKADLDQAAIQLLVAAIKTPNIPEGPRRKSDENDASVGVPQGLPISNHLAEMFLAEFDSAMIAKYPDRYFRFVDDILFVTESAIDNTALDEIEAILTKLGLNLNREKHAQGDVSQGFDYLGYNLSSNGITVRESTRLKFENSLVRNIRVLPRKEPRASNAYVKARWRLNLRITGCVYQGRRIGWLQYFVHLTDLSLLSDFQRMVERLVNADEKWSAFKPKKFLKVLAILKSPSMGLSSSYIPNFDKHSLDDMKRELEKIFDYSKKALAAMTPEEIRGAFYREIGREISALEKDVATNYY